MSLAKRTRAFPADPRSCIKHHKRYALLLNSPPERFPTRNFSQLHSENHAYCPASIFDPGRSLAWFRCQSNTKLAIAAALDLNTRLTIVADLSAVARGITSP